MKKGTLLFGMFSSLIIGPGLHASTDELHIDRFNLDVCTNRIVSHLWFGEEVPDDDIDGAFSAVSISREHSDASSDEGMPEMHSDQTAKISSLIGDFSEVTEDVAMGRSKTGKEIESLRFFVKKLEILVPKNTPSIVEIVLNTIAEKY